MEKLGSEFVKKFAPAFVLLLLTGLASAQMPVRIGLEQAIDLALAHSHTLKAARTQIQQSQAQEITASLRPNPTLLWDGTLPPGVQPA